MWGKSCVSVLLSFAGVVAGKADIIEAPLHGCFIGTGCTESTINETNVTPTITNPLPAFTFTDSPGPITGDLLIEILTPDDTPGVASLTFAIGGTQAGPTDTSTITPAKSNLRGQSSTGALAGLLGLSSASPRTRSASGCLQRNLWIPPQARISFTRLTWAPTSCK